MKFEVLAGKHHEGDVTYSKGEIVTVPHDLVAMFGSKFRRVDVSPLQAAEEQAESTPKPTVKGKKGKISIGLGADASKAARGEDVTAKFTAAVDGKFKVFQRGDKFHVFEGEETTPVKGLSPLAEAEVNDAITAFLEG